MFWKKQSHHPGKAQESGFLKQSFGFHSQITD